MINNALTFGKIMHLCQEETSLLQVKINSLSCECRKKTKTIKWPSKQFSSVYLKLVSTSAQQRCIEVF